MTREASNRKQPQSRLFEFLTSIATEMLSTIVLV
jgi:hypothetical protein